MKLPALALAATMLLGLAAPAGGASAASGANAVLHVHRIVVVQPLTRNGYMSLRVQLGDAGPAGVHGIQTVQVHFGAVTFSASRADVIQAQYTVKPSGDVNVFLAGRFARVQGRGLHAGDTWSMLIDYHPSHVTYSAVFVWAGNGPRTRLIARFGGGIVPYYAIK
jgi:hypothetical protein